MCARSARASPTGVTAEARDRRGLAYASNRIGRFSVAREGTQPPFGRVSEANIDADSRFRNPNVA
jgi:hypothetical protein